MGQLEKRCPPGLPAFCLGHRGVAETVEKWLSADEVAEEGLEPGGELVDEEVATAVQGATGYFVRSHDQ